MNDTEHSYYEFLAEEIISCGINGEQLLQVATYREGKSFSDVNAAIINGGLRGLGDTNRMLAAVTTNLYDVVEIDTSVSFGDFERMLKALD